MSRLSQTVFPLFTFLALGSDCKDRLRSKHSQPHQRNFERQNYEKLILVFLQILSSGRREPSDISQN